MAEQATSLQRVLRSNEAASNLSRRREFQSNDCDHEQDQEEDATRVCWLTQISHSQHNLNPIRAATAETIEESEFTSAQKRCSVFRVEFSENTGEDSAGDEVRSSVLLRPEQNTSAEMAPSAERRLYGTGCSVRDLAPVELKERGGETGPCAHKAGARCSNKGFLPIHR